MRTSTTATNPWGTSVDDGWKDLVVSSAPPPPPREAVDPIVKNRPMPADLNAWQEHGAPRLATIDAPVDEPNFNAGDRRLWIVAGALMALATLVLAVLGLLTFSNGAAILEPAANAPRAAAVVEPARAVQPTHAADSTRAAAAVAAEKASNPRVLKASSRTKHGRHHKRLAAR